MMICPETFYEMRLKGKTPEQIMTVIRNLKREITRLKNIMEHPDYKYREENVHPGEDVQLSMNREYLQRAKQALLDAGGEYIPTESEKKAIDFNNNIPHIRKVVFSIGGFFGGFETRTYTIDGNKIHTDIEHSLISKPSNICDTQLPELDKESFFEELKELHIGEWRRNYDPLRFGLVVMDGTSWHLEIYFSNGRRAVKIYGHNTYPYNFDRLLELFEIEE